ncbi:MAG: sulfatase-like hydrolase/transferase [Lachnospiraceae bacterium]|nr:sulfatase-like hydrolase/transferase [Lachnospiraceae bacterium]
MMKNFIEKVKNQFDRIKTNCKKCGEKIISPFKKLGQTKAMQFLGKCMKPIVKLVKIPFIGYLLLACALNLFLEVLSRHSLFKAFAFIAESPTVFFYNAFIIFVTLSLVLFAKRRVFATVFVCAIWIISAFANFIVLCFRTTPFSAIDILMIRNVMTMLDKYMTEWQMVLSAIGIVLVIALLVYLYIRLPKTKHKRHPFRASAYVIMCGFLIWTLTKVAVETQTVSDNFGNLAYAYNDYGFAYCFSNSIIDVGISKPKEYDEKTIQDIVKGLDYDKHEVVFQTEEEALALEEEQKSAEELKNTTAEETGDIVDHTVENKENASDVSTQTTEEKTEDKKIEDTTADIQNDNILDKEDDEEMVYFKNEPATAENPNIIVIQLESIFDVKYMKDFVVSENPMPTYSRLKNQFSSGLFTVPAVGAGTANTEFEVQTGISTSFFGAGEYPFKTVMTENTCGSMGYDLKRLGYATAGFHNNDATFYERYKDYANLGFDSFSGMEHMYMLNYTPRGWAKDDVLDDLMIERMEQTEGRDYITTISVQAHGRYPKKYTHTLTDVDCEFTGKYAGDDEKRVAWKYYVNMCRETDNMIASLVYKLEQLEEPTVVFMYGDHLPSLNLEEDDLDGIGLYETEWVMWDNFGLEKVDQDLAAYQASTYIFNRLKLKGGLTQSFHNKYMHMEDQERYMDMLEMLAYDTLYGSHYAYDGVNPFPTANMTMGLREITVTGYDIEDDKVWIYGNAFNEFSVVYIDDKSVETQYINYQTLCVSLEDFEEGKELYLAQAGEDHVVLSVTAAIPINEETTEEGTTQQTSEEGTTEE